MRRLRILGPCILVLPLHAQMHHVDKPKQVTRAVGVYEWTGDIAHPDAARLIPVSIFTNSRFEDAGVFLAEPIPLALETGTVYALQRSGDPIGTLDLDFARDIVDKRSSADDNPLGAWYGYGRFLPLSASAPKSNLTQHASKAAVIVGSEDDSQPHFVAPRHPNDSSSTSTTTTAKNDTPAPPDDPDRPHMTRRDGSANSTDNAPSSPGTADIDDDPDRPTLGRRNVPDETKHKKSKQSDSGVEPMPTSLNEDPDRPELHRGKVVSATAPPQLSGVPPNLHQVIAVSDAGTNPQHVFARDWDSVTERAQTLAALQKLADPLARQYLATNHLTPASAGPKVLNASASKPSSSPASSASSKSTAQSHSATATRSATHSTAHSTAVHRTTAAPAPLAFTDEQIAGYTLSYGGLPTFVYTAVVPTGGVSSTLDGPAVHVTVVAQRLPSGELQTSLASVTDEAHLDRTPWMRLVDAVDPDDSHRASLLFELRAKSSRQFALYSLATAEAQQTFITGIVE